MTLFNTQLGSFAFILVIIETPDSAAFVVDHVICVYYDHKWLCPLKDPVMLLNKWVRVAGPWLDAQYREVGRG